MYARMSRFLRLRLYEAFDDPTKMALWNLNARVPQLSRYQWTDEKGEEYDARVQREKKNPGNDTKNRDRYTLQSLEITRQSNEQI